MALSGSINTSYIPSSISGIYSSRPNCPWYITASWTATQDIAAKTSTVTVTVRMGSQANVSAGRTQCYCTVKYNGKSESVVSLPWSSSAFKSANSSLGSKQFTVQHDDAGNASFSINISGKIYYNGTNINGSSTFNLDKINSGLVYIEDGTSFSQHAIYIDNGNEWDMYAPYIDDGNSWQLLT